MSLKKKQQELQKMIRNAKVLQAELEQHYQEHGEAAPAEKRNQLDKLIEDGKALRKEVERLQDLDNLDQFANKPVGKSAAAYRGATRQGKKSWGQIVVESEQFKSNNRRDMQAVNVKEQYASEPAAGGALVPSQRLEEIISVVGQRELTALDVVNQSQTTSNAIEYVEYSKRERGASVVPERDGDNYGIVKRGKLIFNLRTASVKTIAEYIPCSRQILSDAPRLRSLIDNDLTYELRRTLEDQIIQGDGTGSNFLGILNHDDIQERAHQGGERALGADNIADTIRKALTDVRLAFYSADAIGLNPVFCEMLELQKGDDGHYVRIFDPVAMRLWRKQVIELDVLDQSTGLVGAWKLGATIWDRMQVDIRVGEPGDYFERLAVAVLAELRAAFAVIRPHAFVKIDFSSISSISRSLPSISKKQNNTK